MPVTSAPQTSPLDRLHEDFGWTPRQRQVLELLAARRTNGEIAAALGISLDGAKWHVSEVMTKLGTNSRDEAAEYWRAYNRMPLRFSRMVRGLVAGLAVRQVAIGAGVVILVAVGVLGVLLLANLGDDDSEPAASDGTPSPANPTPTGEATTTPSTGTPSPGPVTFENAVGPLFYFLGGDRGAPFLYATDLATGTIVVERPLNRFATVLLSSQGQLVQWENEAPTEVVKVNPDGTTGDPLYYSGTGIGDGAFSHDGSQLALLLSSGIVVLDVNTGETVSAWNNDQLPDGLEGFPHRLQWVADSSALIVDLGVDRDGCGPGHIVLAASGDVRFVPDVGCTLPSPDRNFMADPGSYGCLLVGDEVIRITNPLDGAEAARYEESRAVLTPWDWSPDSQRLLIRRLVVPEPYDPRDGSCDFTGVDGLFDSSDWLVLDVSGAVTPVEDLDALYDDWYPERPIWLDCGQTTVPVQHTAGGQLQALCPDGFSTGTVLVDREPAGMAATLVVLGFVDRQ